MTIRVGMPRDLSVPTDSLAPAERGEVARLLGLREDLQAQLAAIEARLQLFLLHARDKRGLSGPVMVDLDTGMIRICEVQDG